jgi:hypothetical protein
MNLLRKQVLIGLTILFGLNTVSSAQSDTTYWKKGLAGNLTFTQVTLKNWSGGGDNSIALNTYLNLFANYQKERTVWENSLELGYGLLDQGNSGFLKSDDKIIFTTKYGYKLKEGGKLYWSSILDFKTQFDEGLTFQDDGSTNKISDFMAPGYITISTGLEYKPSDAFSLLYSPATGKITIVNNQPLADAGAFGVEPATYNATTLVKITDGEKTRFEFGSFMKAALKKNIAKNVDWESKLELFTAYDENFGNIDVNWQNTFLMKINSWLSASLITQLLYDDDIKIAKTFDLSGLPTDAKPRIQYKQIFGLGLTYKIEK